jgi:hypothetical protein
LRRLAAAHDPKAYGHDTGGCPLRVDAVEKGLVIVVEL